MYMAHQKRHSGVLEASPVENNYESKIMMFSNCFLHWYFMFKCEHCNVDFLFLFFTMPSVCHVFTKLFVYEAQQGGDLASEVSHAQTYTLWKFWDYSPVYIAIRYLNNILVITLKIRVFSHVCALVTKFRYWLNIIDVFYTPVDISVLESAWILS